MYYIYILKAVDYNKYYVGSTEDPFKRLAQHNDSFKVGTYTSKYRPWKLEAVYEAGSTRSEAVRIERFIKSQKSRNLILKLIDADFIPDGELAQLVRVPHVRD